MGGSKSSHCVFCVFLSVFVFMWCWSVAGSILVDRVLLACGLGICLSQNVCTWIFIMIVKGVRVWL